MRREVNDLEVMDLNSSLDKLVNVSKLYFNPKYFTRFFPKVLFNKSSEYLQMFVNTKILEVNLFAFAYRLFHRDFSPINGTLHWYSFFFQLYRPIY